MSGYEDDARQFLANMQQEGLTLTTIDQAFDNWEVPGNSATAQVASAEEHNGDFGKQLVDAVTTY